MTTTSRLITVAAALAAVLLPAGGAALAQTTAITGPTGGAEAVVDRPTIVVSPGALLARTVTIRGRTDEGDAGRNVRVDRQLTDGSWQRIASAVVARDGTFRAPWRTDQPGQVALRAVVERDGGIAAAAAVPPSARLTVFHGAVASWYGPGFFGRRTACGVRLARATVGVAHRTLPCGTPVTLYHRGRIATVPVIDRGPFVEGRDWDVTQAAARRLGLTATARIGVLAPPGVPLRRG
jgi:rare lipoprotein A